MRQLACDWTCSSWPMRLPITAWCIILLSKFIGDGESVLIRATSDRPRPLSEPTRPLGDLHNATSPAAGPSWSTPGRGARPGRAGWLSVGLASWRQSGACCEEAGNGGERRGGGWGWGDRSWPAVYAPSYWYGEEKSALKKSMLDGAERRELRWPSCGHASVANQHHHCRLIFITLPTFH